jgi:hypothetical protein
LEYSDLPLQKVLQTFEKEWKKEKVRTPIRSGSSSGGSYAGRTLGITRICLPQVHLKSIARRYAICDDATTPFSGVALFNYPDWCHMALVKIRETPNEVPPLYPTQQEETEMRTGLNWFFEMVKSDRTITEKPKNNDALIYCFGGSPTLFISAGFIHVQQDFVHSAVMEVTGHLVDYRYESAEERIKHGARLISMKNFYLELAQKIKGH